MSEQTTTAVDNEEKLVDQHAADYTPDEQPPAPESPKVAATKAAIKKTLAEKTEGAKKEIAQEGEIKEEVQIQPVNLEVVKPAEIKDGQINFTPKHLQLIREQIAKDASPAEFELFLMMAYRARLDPLMKQLQFVKYNNQVSYITSIDGYRIIAHRTGDFAGIDEPRYDYDKAGKCTHCAVTGCKFVQGQRVSFTAKVKMSEYNKGRNNWVSMPETMIAKVAEAHMLRKAFPNDLSGIYTQEEMEQAETPQKVQASSQVSTQQTPKQADINQGQLNEIKKIMNDKVLPVDKVKLLCQKSFNKDSLQHLTYQEAYQLINALRKVPSQAPKADDSLADEAVAIFAEQEPMDEIVDTEEVTAAIDAQNGEVYEQS